jgi:hypothetical protein
MDANTNPAQANPTFDLLTLGQLDALHESLFTSHEKLHVRLTDRPGAGPVIPYGPDWNIASAACSELTETMIAVGDEITRRTDAEIARRAQVASPANQSGPYAYIGTDQHMSGE